MPRRVRQVAPTPRPVVAGVASPRAALALPPATLPSVERRIAHVVADFARSRRRRRDSRRRDRARLLQTLLAARSAWCCCSASASRTSRRCTTRPTTRGTPPPSPATEAEATSMPMFRSIVFAAALAGLLAGVLLTIAQQLGTVPLILAAEVFEQAGEPAAAAADADRDRRTTTPATSRGLGAAGRLRAHRLHPAGQHRHRHRLRASAGRGLRPARPGDRLARRACSGAWPGSRSSCWRHPSACRPSCPACRRHSSAPRQIWWIATAAGDRRRASPAGLPRARRSGPPWRSRSW